MSTAGEERGTPFRGLIALESIFDSKKMRLKSGLKNIEKMVVKEGFGYGDGNGSL